MTVAPHAQLQRVLAPELSNDPLEPAEEFAQIASILYDAFTKAGLRCAVVAGSAMEMIQTSGRSSRRAASSGRSLRTRLCRIRPPFDSGNLR